MTTNTLNGFTEINSPNRKMELKETIQNSGVIIEDLINEPIRLKRLINEKITSKSYEFNKQLNVSERLKSILQVQDKLRITKSNVINFSNPILRQKDIPVFFPNTINVIQGQAGVHKSRIAEYICSAFLQLPDCDNELLGFVSSHNENYTVVYVDTERNLTEQLPYALQSILIRAGYDKSENPPNFKYITLLPISRRERFDALEEYLSYIRLETESPLFIVLDVSTDCIEDFNKTDKSMELIDLMNVAINDHNVVFLCLIHENPKSDKARGHFGTELMNKASTVIQVGYEKDRFQNDTDIIRVKYLKCRSTKRHDPFHITYCDEKKGLILANDNDIASMIRSRKLKANPDELVKVIEEYLANGISVSRNEFVGFLCDKFKASSRTIEDRVLELIDANTIFRNDNNDTFELVKENMGRKIFYKLNKSEESNNE